VIVGNTELVALELGQAHAANESVGEIRKACDRAKDLVEQILSFSRQEARDQRVLDLRATLEEDTRLVRAAIPAGVEFVTQYGENVPPVLADPTEIHQVILNLCTNAWHAMEGQPGRITLRLEEA